MKKRNEYLDISKIIIFIAILMLILGQFMPPIGIMGSEDVVHEIDDMFDRYLNTKYNESYVYDYSVNWHKMAHMIELKHNDKQFFWLRSEDTEGLITSRCFIVTIKKNRTIGNRLNIDFTVKSLDFEDVTKEVDEHATKTIREYLKIDEQTNFEIKKGITESTITKKTFFNYYDVTFNGVDTRFHFITHNYPEWEIIVFDNETDEEIERFKKYDNIFELPEIPNFMN